MEESDDDLFMLKHYTKTNEKKNEESKDDRIEQIEINLNDLFVTDHVLPLLKKDVYGNYVIIVPVSKSAYIDKIEGCSVYRYNDKTVGLKFRTLDLNTILAAYWKMMQSNDAERSMIRAIPSLQYTLFFESDKEIMAYVVLQNRVHKKYNGVFVSQSIDVPERLILSCYIKTTRSVAEARILSTCFHIAALQ